MALLQLGMHRLEMLESIQGADPSDTQRITKIAVAARNGSKEAQELLVNELKGVTDAGYESGMLTRPQRRTKVVGNSLIDEDTGGVIYQAPASTNNALTTDEKNYDRYVAQTETQ
jgi:hypothetical protein